MSCQTSRCNSRLPGRRCSDASQVESASVSPVPSPSPPGPRLTHSSCPWTLAKGTGPSTLSAFSFQRWNPRTGAALSFLTPPPPPAPQLQEIWSTPLYLVLVHLELVPSPFGNHVINPFSVLVSYFFFEVYCLPKMTSLRLGDRGERAADS